MILSPSLPHLVEDEEGVCIRREFWPAVHLDSRGKISTWTHININTQPSHSTAMLQHVKKDLLGQIILRLRVYHVFNVLCWQSSLKKRKTLPKVGFHPLPLLPPASFLFAKFIKTTNKQTNKNNHKSVSSSLENSLTRLCAHMLISGSPSFRTEHKRPWMKRGEEGMVPGTSLGGWASPANQGKPVPVPLSASDIPDVRDKLDAGYDIWEPWTNVPYWDIIWF